MFSQLTSLTPSLISSPLPRCHLPSRHHHHHHYHIRLPPSVTSLPPVTSASRRLFSVNQAPRSAQSNSHSSDPVAAGSGGGGLSKIAAGILLGVGAGAAYWALSQEEEKKEEVKEEDVVAETDAGDVVTEVKEVIESVVETISGDDETPGQITEDNADASPQAEVESASPSSPAPVDPLSLAGVPMEEVPLTGEDTDVKSVVEEVSAEGETQESEMKGEETLKQLEEVADSLKEEAVEAVESGISEVAKEVNEVKEKAVQGATQVADLVHEHMETVAEPEEAAVDAPSATRTVLPDSYLRPTETEADEVSAVEAETESEVSGAVEESNSATEVLQGNGSEEGDSVVDVHVPEEEVALLVEESTSSPLLSDPISEEQGVESAAVEVTEEVYLNDLAAVEEDLAAVEEDLDLILDEELNQSQLLMALQEQIARLSDGLKNSPIDDNSDLKAAVAVFQDEVKLTHSVHAVELAELKDQYEAALKEATDQFNAEKLLLAQEFEEKASQFQAIAEEEKVSLIRQHEASYTESIEALNEYYNHHLQKLLEEILLREQSDLGKVVAAVNSHIQQVEEQYAVDDHISRMENLNADLRALKAGRNDAANLLHLALVLNKVNSSILTSGRRSLRREFESLSQAASPFPEASQTVLNVPSVIIDHGIKSSSKLLDEFDEISRIIRRKTSSSTSIISLSRAQSYLVQGDIPKAIAEVDTLGKDVRTHFRLWRSDANAHEAVRQSLAHVSRFIETHHFNSAAVSSSAEE